MLDLHYIMQRPSKEDFLAAAHYLTQNTDELVGVFTFFTSGTTKERNRSAWLLHQVSDADATVFYDWHKNILAHAPQAKTDAEKRFTTRLFGLHGLPADEDLQGKLLQQTFDWILNPKESIATKANCLEILYQFTKTHPEIENELRAIIADQYDRSSAAFKARAQMVLKRLATTTKKMK